mmetsp:Transcript_35069/g.110836  ORF Transcript_35069/g.110836 Transcript_35069/m.110836 type:complete len:228 (+) Transcript_35069:1444-2127(+)
MRSASANTMHGMKPRASCPYLLNTPTATSGDTVTPTVFHPARNWERLIIARSPCPSHPDFLKIRTSTSRSTSCNLVKALMHLRILSSATSSSSPSFFCVRRYAGTWPRPDGAADAGRTCPMPAPPAALGASRAETGRPPGAGAGFWPPPPAPSASNLGFSGAFRGPKFPCGAPYILDCQKGGRYPLASLGLGISCGNPFISCFLARAARASAASAARWLSFLWFLSP